MATKKKRIRRKFYSFELQVGSETDRQLFQIQQFLATKSRATAARFAIMRATGEIVICLSKEPAKDLIAPTITVQVEEIFEDRVKSSLRFVKRHIAGHLSIEPRDVTNRLAYETAIAWCSESIKQDTKYHERRK